MFLSLSLWVCAAKSEIVEVGMGSYTTDRPENLKPLQQDIFRTAEVTGPTPTNQWWSSLVWKQFSENMFPHPLAVRCQKDGLAVTYSGSSITSLPRMYKGGKFDEMGDFVIGNSAVRSFADASLGDHSDWFVTAHFQERGGSLRASFGHGSPFVFCRIEAGAPKLSFSGPPEMWSGLEGESAVLGITVNGHHYGIFGASGSTWTLRGDSILEGKTETDYFSVALLPERSKEALDAFSACAHSHVIDTEVKPSFGDGRITTDFRFETEKLEGEASHTIFSLYPHQWKYSDSKLTDWKYRSVRGLMKVARGKAFVTSVPVQGTLPVLPVEGIPDHDRMRKHLEKEVSEKVEKYKDTYWEGKDLGKLASLSGIAGLIGEEELQLKFISELKTRLANWFTASEGEKSPLFYYDKWWGALIGSESSYNTDLDLNDHHFHYGYFIRAAAEIARHDRDWARDWGPMVELLIRDIVSIAPDDSMFPRLRCFDLYAGHSWASGHGAFADGNNQESSSESMNAWYGIIQWAEIAGKSELRDWALFLHNTERTAVEEYWFDVSGTNFPEDFPHEAIALVWGGQGGYWTWFSEHVDHIHGINWLPFTPSSISLGRSPDYVRRNYEYILSRRPEKEDYGKVW
ncbi:MAG: glycosyl hydrolase, partial [Verrucomicrobiota bacterium]